MRYNHLFARLITLLCVLAGCATSVYASEHTVLFRVQSPRHETPQGEQVVLLPESGEVEADAIGSIINIASSEYISMDAVISAPGKGAEVEYYVDGCSLAAGSVLQLSATNGAKLVAVECRLFSFSSSGTLGNGEQLKFDDEAGGWYTYSVEAYNETMFSLAQNTSREYEYLLVTYDIPGQEPIAYPFSWDVADHISISVTDGEKAITSGSEFVEGTTLNVDITSDLGFYISQVMLNDVARSLGDMPTHCAFELEITEPINLTVTAAEIPVVLIPVSWSNPTGGNIAVQYGENLLTPGDSIPEGAIINISVTAEDGYVIQSLTLNGTDYPIEENCQSVTLSHAVTEPLSIVAVMSKPETMYTVSWVASEGGTITVSCQDRTLVSGESVPDGTELSISVRADSGYTIADVTLDDSSLIVNDLSGMDTTIVVSSPTHIAARFSHLSYPVSWNEPEHCTVEVMCADTLIANGAEIPSNSELVIRVKPQPGYTIERLLAGSLDLTAAPGDTLFCRITVTDTLNISVTVSERSDVHFVEWNTDPHANIKLFDAQDTELTPGALVPDGEKITLSVGTSPNYHIRSITANGQKLNLPSLATLYFGSLTVNRNMTLDICIAPDTVYCVDYKINGGGVAIFRDSRGYEITPGSYIPNHQTVSLEPIADEGYQLDSIAVHNRLLLPDQLTGGVVIVEIDQPTCFAIYFSPISGVALPSASDDEIIAIHTLSGVAVPLDKPIQPGYYLVTTRRGTRKLVLQSTLPSE